MTHAPSHEPIQRALLDAIDASSTAPAPGHPRASVAADPGVAAAITAGADVNKPLQNGATPLMWAIANQKPGAVRALLDAPVDLAARDSVGDVAMTVATMIAPLDDVTVLEMLLDAGADPDARGANGDPAIVWLMRSFHLDGIALMARRGADMNARTRTKTPLILEAAFMHAWDVVDALIQGGADALVEDRGVTVARLLDDGRATPPDSPLFPSKVKVWHYLASRGEELAPLPYPN